MQQLSFADVFSDFLPKKPEPKVAFSEGQVIWKVKRAEVFEYVHTDRRKTHGGLLSWVVDDDRIYLLSDINGGYSCCSERNIGTSYFLNYEDAVAQADKNRSLYEILTLKDLNLLYSRHYLRYNYDGKPVEGFFFYLGDNRFLAREHETFIHIRSFKSEEAGLTYYANTFSEENRIEDACSPDIPMLYKCTDNSSWDYAEVGYGSIAVLSYVEGEY
ncbi:hypothetical protein M2146_001131 [Lachnospiraceae bacterium PF1-22]